MACVCAHCSTRHASAGQHDGVLLSAYTLLESARPYCNAAPTIYMRRHAVPLSYRFIMFLVGLKSYCCVVRGYQFQQKRMDDGCCALQVGSESENTVSDLAMHIFPELYYQVCSTAGTFCQKRRDV